MNGTLYGWLGIIPHPSSYDDPCEQYFAKQAKVLAYAGAGVCEVLAENTLNVSSEVVPIAAGAAAAYYSGNVSVGIGVRYLSDTAISALIGDPISDPWTGIEWGNPRNANLPD